MPQTRLKNFIGQINYLSSKYTRVFIFLTTIISITIIFSINSLPINRIDQFINPYVFFNVATFTWLFLFYLYIFEQRYFKSTTYLWFLSILTVIFLLAARILYIENEVHSIPIVIYSLLITIFLNRQVALVLLLLSSAVFVGLLDFKLSIIFPLLTGGFLATFVSKNVESRTLISNTSILIGLSEGIAYIFTVAISGINNIDIFAMLKHANLWFISGMVSGLATVGIIPFIEETFSLITPTRLAELSDSSQPALVELGKRAPGTYQHSLMVSVLSENAAKVIGANSSLCRVGSYYHDIGKMQNPLYFIENQLDRENPHDRLNNPEVSANIIISHTKSGLAVAKKYKLPRFVYPFILEHHGTDYVSYFFNKASEYNKLYIADKFSYIGPVPQSRETAIVMLADSCEAAIRTINPITRCSVNNKINSIILHKQETSQLSNSNLNQSDLKRIADSFVHTILEMNHKRIEYPDI